MNNGTTPPAQSAATITVSLRPLHSDDAPRLVELFNDPGVYRYMAAANPIPYTLDHAHRFIAACSSGKRAERAIVFNHMLVGCIGVTLEGDIMMGYWLGRDYWGQGIMPQAVRLFLQELAQDLPPETKIQAKVFAPHQRSIKILLDAGFRMLPGFVLMPMRDGLPHVTYVYERILRLD